MRILVMTDSPFIHSGQARVGREIAVGLASRGHEIGYLGWWHDSKIIPNLPHNIQFWWTNNSNYGSDVLDIVVNSFQPEVLLTIGDMWNLHYIIDPKYCRTRKFFQWCSYIPVDGEAYGGGLPPGVADIVKEIDIPVAYTDYACRAILKTVTDQETVDRIHVIYHGVDTGLFKPVDPSERQRIRDEYGVGDKFMFLMVGRNQSRKNLPELFKAWKKFISTPDVSGKVVLWPHTNFYDSMGWNLDDLFKVLNLQGDSIMFFNQVAHGTNETMGIPDHKMASLYQAADAFILLSNEGFGLPTLEAMASRVPCVLLDHAASGELGADGRAALVPKVGFMTWMGRYLTEKPVPDIDKTVESMRRLMFDKPYRTAIAEAGYQFSKNLTWSGISDQWNMLFMRKEIPFLSPVHFQVVV